MLEECQKADFIVSGKENFPQKSWLSLRYKIIPRQFVIHNF